MDLDRLLYLRENGTHIGVKLDLILLNTEIRAAVVDRISRYKVHMPALFTKYGMDGKLITKFLNTKNYTTDKNYSKLQWDFLILCRLLGLEIRVVAVEKEPLLDELVLQTNINNIIKKNQEIKNHNKKFFNKHHEDSND